MIANFIGGEWTGSAGGRTRERRNPADERELVAIAPDSDSKDAADAVAAVADGYREWADRLPQARAEVLERAATILADRADDIALLALTRL